MVLEKETYHKCVIERGIDVSNAKDELSITNTGSKRDIFWLLLGLRSHFCLSYQRITMLPRQRATVYNVTHCVTMTSLQPCQYKVTLTFFTGRRVKNLDKEVMPLSRKPFMYLYCIYIRYKQDKCLL
jgi:hypothetical protein